MKPIVAILMGSDSDAESLKPCGAVLRQLEQRFEKHKDDTRKKVLSKEITL